MTGAGVSTDSNIPDYRSGWNTILKTGPGKWETDENKIKFYEIKGKPQLKPSLHCIPNFCHMMI